MPPAPPAPPAPPVTPAARAAGNGSALPDGAKEAAAQAKSAVERAGNAVPRPAPEQLDSGSRSPVPFLAAFAVTLLAILWVRRLRRQADES